MLDLPNDGAMFPPESVWLRRILQPDGSLWRSSRDADVLVLGDSFSNVYSDPALHWGTGAGLAEQLALRLQVGVDVIALNDGGVNGCREQLARQPARLAGTRVVVWEFAERSLTATAGEWREIPVRSVPAAPVGDQP
ncbi:MAG: hypothetical protein HYU66_26905 [Armatimonadetes bacterium]|nr:hypothetical protein [Armatimonadota bacterium]